MDVTVCGCDTANCIVGGSTGNTNSCLVTIMSVIKWMKVHFVCLQEEHEKQRQHFQQEAQPAAEKTEA